MLELGGRSSVSLCLGEKISTSSSFAVIGGLNRMIFHAVFHLLGTVYPKNEYLQDPCMVYLPTFTLKNQPFI